METRLLTRYMMSPLLFDEHQAFSVTLVSTRTRPRYLNYHVNLSFSKVNINGEIL